MENKLEPETYYAEEAEGSMWNGFDEAFNIFSTSKGYICSVTSKAKRDFVLSQFNTRTPNNQNQELIKALEALEDIRTHQRSIAGKSCTESAVWFIANRALENHACKNEGTNG